MRSVSKAVVLSALLLAACGTTPDTPAEVTETRGPTGVVPQGLDEYYGQPLTWEGCGAYGTTPFDRQALAAPGLQCARLTVPLDYSAPDGDRITLGLLRKPATRSGERIGSLVTNPGGPGATGLASAAVLDSAALNERFDFVGFDPRGVGSSEPTVRCRTDAERDEQRAEDDGKDADLAEIEAEQRDYAAKCAERTGKGAAMLANVGTRDVARDIDVLRSVLGDEKLTYLGRSYGTRIGTVYAQTFPANVRALVLDGALDPTEDAVAEVVNQRRGFQKAFEDFVAWCVQRQDCALGNNAQQAQDEFKALVMPLRDRPVSLADGRVLSFGDAETAVVQALYSEQVWQTLNSGLAELRRNSGRLLMALADSYEDRGANGRYSTLHDAFIAVRCVDDERVTDPAVLLEVDRQYKEAAPFLDDGDPPVAAPDTCAYWPAPATGTREVPSPEAGLPPVLVVSTTGDPATPYDAGVNLAKALGGALLTYEATQHTAFLQGVKCVDDVGVAYLIDLTLPPEGTRCS
ncbi:alpha/beta hydrolase [Actinokineospora pegani]|uniref:alpha/beta hydrolase n=1 Tax=Actinokineospora pegani TaxID=2654637 RepID=UPI0018D4511D|nr:alpha/beta hydrolase [Actinokineospora pegani]